MLRSRRLVLSMYTVSAWHLLLTTGLHASGLSLSREEGCNIGQCTGTLQYPAITCSHYAGFRSGHPILVIPLGDDLSVVCRNKHVNRALEIAETLLADPAGRTQGNALAGTLKKAAHRPNHKAKVSHGKLQTRAPLCAVQGLQNTCLMPSYRAASHLAAHTTVLHCAVPPTRRFLHFEAPGERQERVQSTALKRAWC